ncbi:hypothetical protein B5F54_11315 [Anaeromassilibacillus sp. An250]|nr:hypothetical protein B5F54_11315 [Anaeromassilibacillus sp. An250]
MGYRAPIIREKGGKNMKANKKRIVLSALSLVLVFCLLAGGTMAWFTDTEKVAGNFSAGILDIEVNPDPENGNFTTTKPMEFKNLRPMLLDNFDKELVESGDVNNLENNNQDPENYPEDNLPIYFRPVHIENRGTLPIYIHLGMNATAGNDTEPVLYGDNKYEIDQNQYPDKPCANTLEDALKIFVYKKDGDTWTRLENINLNKETATSNEKICYDPTDFIGAGEEVTYIIGGYLPSTAGNEYQGQHYHGALEVWARQVDQGPYDHGDTGVDPEFITVDVPATLVNVSIGETGEVVESGLTIPMTFAAGTTQATGSEVMEQIEQFLETYSHDGVKYKYAGSYAPPTFGIIDNGDGTYSASFEGTDYKSLRIDVSPRG